MPFEQLADRAAALLLDGEGKYYGIRGWFRWLEGRTYKMHVRVFLSRYRSYRLCPDCDGGRLQARRAAVHDRRPQRRRRPTR